MKSRHWFVVAGCVLAANTWAHGTGEQAKAPSYWNGTNVALGFNMNTGNTDTSSLNATGNILYKNKPWSNAAHLGAQWGRSNGVLNKQKYTAVDQLNYNFQRNDRSFAFMNGDFTSDYFSAYRYVFVGSAGYGRDFYRSDAFVWSAQLGPGLRRNEIRSDDDSNNHIIAMAQTNLRWNITDKGTLSQMLRYDYGAPFNYLQSVTSFQNQITGHIAIQASFEVENYSKIPPNSSNTKKTDTVTTLSLVYNF